MNELLNAQPDPEAALGIMLKSSRLEALAEKASALVKELPQVPKVFSTLFEHCAGPDLANLPADCAPSRTANDFEISRIVRLVEWTESSEQTALKLGLLVEELIRHIHRRLQLSFSVYAVGDFAFDAIGPRCDAEIVLVANAQDARQNDLEAHAFLGFLEGLNHYGLRSKITIRRLNNLLFIPAGGFGAGEVAALSASDFYLISSARPIVGSGARIAELVPIRPERLRGLVEHKRKVATQEVSVKYRRRDVLDGEGGLHEICWLLVVNEGRYPTATGRTGVTFERESVEPSFSVSERLRSLMRAQLLLPNEVDALHEAWEFLSRVRNFIYLLEIDDRNVPENPDKLAALAQSLNYAEGNEFLRNYELHTENVRAIYQDSIDRLRT
ncbi:MAG: hypothetical protein ABL949_15115 [Fimbriimonadaceae bacterium]